MNHDLLKAELEAITRTLSKLHEEVRQNKSRCKAEQRRTDALEEKVRGLQQENAELHARIDKAGEVVREIRKHVSP
jgi:chromosome segregation ATPase